jgi:AraC-like DNA-binding protein
MEIQREISKFEIICHTMDFYNLKYSLHWHDRYELCQVMKNDLLIVVEGQKIRACAGDIIAINERVVHQFVIDHGDASVRILQLPMRVLLNFKSTVKPLKAHITAKEIDAAIGLKDRLNALLEIIEQEDKSGFMPNDPFLQSMASSVYFLLERYFSESYELFAKEHERWEFYRVVEYVNAHFKEDITVESVSKQLYISRGKLASLFKKYAGEGLSEYINKLRIKNANLILSQGASITEASMDSGFRSIRTFNNVYKGIMNMTPSEYVRKKK